MDLSLSRTRRHSRNITLEEEEKLCRLDISKHRQSRGEVGIDAAISRWPFQHPLDPSFP